MATAEIHVTLKPALLDTQGATVRKALHQLGYSAVQDVRIGKFITLEVDGAQAGPQMQAMLEEMCQKLLANPVIEDFEIAIDEATSSALSRQSVAQVPVAPLVEVPLGAPTQVLTNAGNAPDTSIPHTSATGTATMPLTPLSRMTSPPLGASTPTASTSAASVQHGAQAGLVAQSVAQDVPLATHGSIVSGPTTPHENPLTAHSPSALSEVPLSGMTPSEQLQAATVSSSDVATPDPFAMDYARFEAMGPADKMALQEIAWRKYGAWIKGEIEARRAAWIMCVGQRAVADGDSLESFPSDADRARAGRESGLVPWVFVRPPSL